MDAGIFIWNLKTIKSELEILQPDISNLFAAGEKLYYTPNEDGFINMF